MMKKHFQLFADKIKADVDAALQHCRPDVVDDAVTKARYAAALFADVAAEDNPPIRPRTVPLGVRVALASCLADGAFAESAPSGGHDTMTPKREGPAPNPRRNVRRKVVD